MPEMKDKTFYPLVLFIEENEYVIQMFKPVYPQPNLNHDIYYENFINTKQQ